MEHIKVIELPHKSAQGAVYTLLDKVNEIVAWINEQEQGFKPVSVTVVKPPEWISVKDRLPEEGVPVLVTGVVKKGDHPYLVDYIYKDDWFWWPMNYNRTIGFVITHWMPLPEPPEAV